jgi:hypothetical protein
MRKRRRFQLSDTTNTQKDVIGISCDMAMKMVLRMIQQFFQRRL